MPKYNYYAVALGVDPTSKEQVQNLIFETWNECKPYVVGVEGAKYKGFLSHTEANMWLEMMNGESLESTSSSSPLLGDGVYDESFKLLCDEVGLFPKEMTLWLQRKFVEDYRFVKNKVDALNL